VAEFDSRFVMLAVRIFVDPADPDDAAAVNQLHDQLRVDAASAALNAHANFDADSLDATGSALLELSQGVPDLLRTFGTRKHVDAVCHLIGTASPGEVSPRTKRSTLSTRLLLRPASIKSSSATYRLTRSGPSPSTTVMGSSSRTNSAPTT
jgi:hypothetical protein